MVFSAGFVVCARHHHSGPFGLFLNILKAVSASVDAAAECSELHHNCVVFKNVFLSLPNVLSVHLCSVFSEGHMQEGAWRSNGAH